MSDDGHYLTTRHDGCTCQCISGATRERGSGVLISPPEWEQADDCPVHPLPEWCETCEGGRLIDEEFEDQIGFEEQARPVRVTRLDCGHEIVTPSRWNA